MSTHFGTDMKDLAPNSVSGYCVGGRRTNNNVNPSCLSQESLRPGVSTSHFSFRTDAQIWGVVSNRWAEIICINQGEMSATNVTRSYTLIRKEGKRIVQQESKPINNQLG